MKRRSPLGIKLLAIFFAFGACMCALTISLLLFPGSTLDSLWRLNPDAHAAFQSLGKMPILLMLIVGVACALSAIGLARSARWGRWLALIIFAVNLVGDLANAIARKEPDPKYLQPCRPCKCHACWSSESDSAARRRAKLLRQTLLQ